MYKHYILTTIFLMILPRLSILKSIPRDEEQNEGFNYTVYDEIYDQKQNGSYNVRVGIDGVNVLWQPSSDLSYDLMDAIMETALIGLVENLPWPSTTDSTDTLEDFFNSTTSIESNRKNSQKVVQKKTNLTSEPTKSKDSRSLADDVN
ncbi:uncharacterized protein LOC123314474 [Coccinella septempunctata]|uniref:uncharacterized protein LOC123314474 n=1 Tax=Coccinella septempunctata TaxID=41139 RepID=UPI001D0751F1|nr:uncharacterized protein LOC123314474 [Coccinella septempunctata]